MQGTGSVRINYSWLCQNVLIFILYLILGVASSHVSGVYACENTHVMCIKIIIFLSFQGEGT